MILGGKDTEKRYIKFYEHLQFSFETLRKTESEENEREREKKLERELRINNLEKFSQRLSLCVCAASVMYLSGKFNNFFFYSTHIHTQMNHSWKVHVRLLEERKLSKKREKWEREKRKKHIRKLRSGHFCIECSVRELSSYSLERILVRILCALAVIVPV